MNTEIQNHEADSSLSPAALRKYSALGSIMLRKGLVTEEQMNTAMAAATGRGERALSRELANLGFVNPDDIARALSEHLNIPYFDIKEVEIEPQTPHLMPEDFLRRHTVIPFKVDGEYLQIAVCPPMDLSVLDEVELTTGYKAKPFVSTERDINFVLNQHFSAMRRTKQTIVDMQIEESVNEPEGELVFDEIVDSVDSPPIVRLVVDIIDGAINERSSDIHLEPQEDDMRVRYRVDGVLQDIMRVPRHIEASVISRIKILAGMDITEKRAPQDGHMNIRKSSKEYDLRISTFPTVNGEKAVMRILSKDTMLLRLEELGIPASDLDSLKELTSRPFGMILVTGPTGCGKTTTLYSVLSRISTATENICTIEDPVEYRLPGINQSQVSDAASLTFASGLRSLLRQDPNVIMVGEIRDSETADIAIQAALTGHLVFSTLHTSDSTSAVTRLVDMGVKEYLISASVIGVIAQRLVRTICPACRESYSADVADLFREFGIRSEKKGKTTLYRGRGCKFCAGQGYHGRIGVFEMLTVSEDLRDLIAQGRPAHELRKLAIREGMSPLRHSAFKKVLDGVTTLEEVRRSIFISQE